MTKEEFTEKWELPVGRTKLTERTIGITSNN